jgi:hypothetical protein
LNVGLKLGSFGGDDMHSQMGEMRY